MSLCNLDFLGWPPKIAHTYNPSILGGGDQEDGGSRSDREKSDTIHLKIN
jgi:hypothetical protein